MTEQLVDATAVLVSAAGVVVAAWTWLLTRSGHPALPILLDFLLAAGLLRLTVDQSWPAIGTAAVALALRRTAGAAVALASSAHRGSLRSS